MNVTTRDLVLSALTEIAPEIDADQIRDDTPLREEVDLDSMDWLRFLTMISEQLHVDIPESTYASLRTLGDVVRFADEHSTRT